PPNQPLTFLEDWQFEDSLYVDDRFEMYIVYAAGAPNQSPRLQKALGKMIWNWGGLVVFDWNGSNAVHNIRSLNATPPIFQATNTMVPMNGKCNPNLERQCPMPGRASIHQQS